MDSITARVKQVHDELGNILEHPVLYGLSEPAPKRLVDALTSMRQNLKNELVELDEWKSDSDDLMAELSQDADNATATNRG